MPPAVVELLCGVAAAAGMTLEQVAGADPTLLTLHGVDWEEVVIDG